jgi:hypothetical protein
MPKQPISQPGPDEYGRLRVRDSDTGHERTIHAAELGHGNYVVIDQPASHPLTGEPVPPVHGSLSGPPTPAKQAESTKENTDA